MGHEISEACRLSPPGMAYFAGTGPAGAICKECSFFQYDAATPYTPMRCAKYVAMMKTAGQNRPAVFRVPPSTAACKYFDPIKFQSTPVR